MSEQRFTYEFGHPYTDSGDVAAVIVDAEGLAIAVYVNGESVALDHPYADIPRRLWTMPVQGLS